MYMHHVLSMANSLERRQQHISLIKMKLFTRSELVRSELVLLVMYFLVDLLLALCIRILCTHWCIEITYAIFVRNAFTTNIYSRGRFTDAFYMPWQFKEKLASLWQYIVEGKLLVIWCPKYRKSGSRLSCAIQGRPVCSWTIIIFRLQNKDR